MSRKRKVELMTGVKALDGDPGIRKQMRRAQEDGGGVVLSFDSRLASQMVFGADTLRLGFDHDSKQLTFGRKALEAMSMGDKTSSTCAGYVSVLPVGLDVVEILSDVLAARPSVTAKHNQLCQLRRRMGRTIIKRLRQFSPQWLEHVEAGGVVVAVASVNKRWATVKLVLHAASGAQVELF